MADVVQIRDLRVYLEVDAGTVKAVDGVSFRIPEGRTVALVGESGSGKTMVAQAVMSILPRVARIESGEILFHDPRRPGEVTDIARLHPDGPEVRAIRGGRISIIFQEPMTALSPLHTVGNQIGEALMLHRSGLGKAERRDAVLEMLKLVGFADPVKAEHTYPFELSGGLRQRAMIAMALVCRPALLVADEPTTALDVTIQAQILHLMQGLCRRLGVALMIITHNLGVVARYADRVNVMYGGRIVEQGSAAEIYGMPSHPYTIGLLHSVPRLDRPRSAPLDPIPGNPPDPFAPPSGCSFRPRCRLAAPHCSEAVPPLRTVAAAHRSACFELQRLCELVPA
jgi:oligopeptide/dipeptide ABC transporter ATP-binding protein